MIFRKLLLAAALLLPTGAAAEWKKAESNHFIVYGEIGEERLRAMALRLEKLHLTQATMTGLVNEPKTIKVKVYVVDSFDDVQRTMPFPRQGVAGYYSATPRGPYTVISTESNANQGFSSRLVLFHELTHHFMFQYFNATYPLWYVEGFADFIGTTNIKDDSNTVRMGDASASRYLTFATTSWYPIRKLLEARSYDDLGERVDIIYAEGWLLTHYLHFGGKRDGQLEKYLTAINRGVPFAQAASEAFGDLGKLDAELQAYSRRRNALPGRSITFKPVSLGEAKVTPVSAAQDAMMLHDIRLHAGVAREDAGRFADRVRRDALRFPNDAFAQQLRAEADYNANDDADLNAAVDRWLAIAPQDPKAMLFDGLRKARALKAAKSTDKAAWTAARAPIVAATRIAQDDPQIFKGFYDTFVMEGVTPSAGAQKGLFRALELVPQDDELRYQLAADFERRGMIGDARNTIRPAALQLPDKVRSDAEIEKDRKDREKEAIAGVPTHETAREMLNRLDKNGLQKAEAGN
ncbi:hypothetical protein RZN05_20260 [Sphingomonas sp. HF-S4]|uniref:DUF1570 domain-containing protein n=1 Tax=Sphingomonas agrestis TaxID=3080540 RepID=A0ABU3YD65_9SPHN|nr:hypothetical protein [Sphingomonas sp. HF-S4]MDV3459339.1 hypothetical protein [Sphingomonas sp. HF-S4]